MQNNETDATGRSQAGFALRCLGWLIVIPIAAIALIFVVAEQYQNDWADARPPGLTDDTWDSRRSLCESAKMGAEDCGKTPPATIEKAAAKQREKERLELCKDDASYDAIANAKTAVSDRLRAPSTAEWSDITASLQDCEWRVTGTVDAQNGFGGIVRSSFQVRLRRASEQTWIPISVTVR